MALKSAELGERGGNVGLAPLCPLNATEFVVFRDCSKDVLSKQMLAVLVKVLSITGLVEVIVAWFEVLMDGPE